MRLRCFSALFVFGLIVAYPPRARAADGELDPAFGLDGRVTMNWLPGNARPTALAIDNAQRIIVAGQAQAFGGVDQFMLLRLRSDGSQDPGFATSKNGFFLYDFKLNGIGYYGGNTVYAVRVQANDRVVAAGCAATDASQSHFAALRLMDNGKLDPAFGTGGTLHFSAPFAMGNCFHDLVVEPNGRVLFAGYTTQTIAVDGNIEFKYYTATAALTSAGAFDTSFLNGNVNELSFVPDAQFSTGFVVDVDDSGRIYVAGVTYTPGPEAGGVLRLLDNGTVDPTFGQNGRQVLNLKYSQISAIHLLPSGGVMLAGNGTNAQDQKIIFLARLLPDGSPDTDFAGSGIAEYPIGNAGFVSLLVPTRRHGWLVAAGDAQNRGVVLVRTDRHGIVDASFGNNGVLHALFDPDINTLFHVAKPAMQADGKLVVAGYAPEAAANGNYDFRLMRILADYDTLFVDGFDAIP